VAEIVKRGERLPRWWVGIDARCERCGTRYRPAEDDVLWLAYPGDQLYPDGLARVCLLCPICSGGTWVRRSDHVPPEPGTARWVWAWLRSLLSGSRSEESGGIMARGTFDPTTPLPRYEDLSTDARTALARAEADLLEQEEHLAAARRRKEERARAAHAAEGRDEPLWP
jgi:hypothetical protein